MSPHQPVKRNCSDHSWVNALFLGLHTIYINLIVTALVIAALPAQARQIEQHGHLSLSLMGLASQAVIFAVLALSWVFPVRFEYDLSVWFSSWGSFVSWATVGNGAFAVVQGILLWIALRGVGVGV
jgi:hypothetical protein